MKNDLTPEQEEFIDRWIRGDLTEEEAASFAQLRANNAAVDQEVRFRELVSEELEEEQRKRWKADLQTISISPAPARNWTRWAVAAGILALISIGLVNALQPGLEERLYTTHFEPYPNIIDPTIRGSNKEEARLIDALKAYEMANYEEAVKLLESEEVKMPEHYFYLAQALMAQGKTVSATPHLQQILSNEKAVDLHPQSRWYLALAFLHQEMLEQCRVELEQLATSTSSYQKNAKKLLQQLE